MSTIRTKYNSALLVNPGFFESQKDWRTPAPQMEILPEDLDAARLAERMIQLLEQLGFVGFRPVFRHERPTGAWRGDKYGTPGSPGRPGTATYHAELTVRDVMYLAPLVQVAIRMQGTRRRLILTRRSSEVSDAMFDDFTQTVREFLARP